MIPMGYEYESFFAYLVGGLVVLLWFITIVALAISCTKQSLPRIKTMAFWDWAELSGWSLAIGALAAYDYYLIFL
ncbi:MAG: hypothetical protein UV07_C0027G0008 [Candidatus Azambacteria bacterium GW2011_GWB1_42_17]|uniref:Uncharacterized protein n=2 Tax=Candidatus Azamiibacteriota TaxID=1752741 RepID=A0A0G0Z4Q4_9BACT|nr:MAG: hypothetical protein UV07_C0027G0008 [Candidatus Azambacteria bacterium GW2011_GWB1_42_17]KKS87876.1 MAG: hypothetical protein UV62_C0022G0008 [Parcubacteria group bacterium GW2011_GWC1_43_11]